MVFFSRIHVNDFDRKNCSGVYATGTFLQGIMSSYYQYFAELIFETSTRFSPEKFRKTENKSQKTSAEIENRLVRIICIMDNMMDTDFSRL